MPFDDQTSDRISERLREATRGAGPCPMCATDSWTLGGEFALIPAGTIAGGRPGVWTHSVPCVALFCNHCGYAAFFSAIILGLGDLLT